MNTLDHAGLAEYLLDCSEQHMGDVLVTENAAVLATQAQARGLLAVAGAIEELTRQITALRPL